MKKFLSLLLVCVMLVSLCGCDILNSDFSLGEVLGNRYENEFLGLSCTLPADWRFYTQEEILELNDLAEDLLDEDIAKQLKKADLIYDMFAQCGSDSSNMNVVMEKLKLPQIIRLDIKKTLEAQKDTIEWSYRDMGYTNVKVSYQTVEVDGKEFDGLRITAKIQGVDFYGTVFAFKAGTYMANVTVCSIQTDKTDTLLSYFTVE